MSAASLDDLVALLPLAREAWPRARDDGWRMSLMQLCVQMLEFSGSQTEGNRATALRALRSAMLSLADERSARLQPAPVCSALEEIAAWAEGAELMRRDREALDAILHRRGGG